MRFLIVALSLLAPALLCAVEHSGTVRAADQFIPGATVTARQGGAKLVTYTDENGRYSLDLTPGDWEIEIRMFGFQTLTGTITIHDQFTSRDWTLEMPRVEPEPAKPAPKPAAPARTPTTAAAGGGRGRYGQGRMGMPGRSQPQQSGPPAFQNADVTATDAGAEALAMAAGDGSDLAATADTSDAYLMNGSTSGGLAAASDDFARMGRGRGGPGGPMGPGALGAGPGGNGLMTLGAGLGANGDPLGMGGFGAAGADAGFGPGPGGFGFGGPGGGGGGRGGGGGGRGGGRGGGGAQGRGGRGRGPFGGQYAQFGNRRGRGRQSPYQGSIAVTVTNSALNAAPFSLNGQNQPKPSSANETIAFNFGGPVRIPHIVSNDKWSFYVNFTNHEGRTANNLVSTVPSDAERAGDLSAATQTLTLGGVRQVVPVVIYDPTNNAPFPNAVIPSTRLNSAALGLLAYFPQPTYPNLATYNYAISESTPSMSNSLGVRLQGSVTNKDRISFNEQYQLRSSTSEQLFGFDDTSKGYGLSSTFGWVHMFRARVNNSAQLAFSRNLARNQPFFAYKTDIEGDLGIAGPDTSPIDYGPPTLGFTNFGSLSDGTYQSTRAQTTNFTDTFTYIAHKNHNLSFGFGYRRMQNNVLSYASSRGSFTFSGAMTQGPGCGGDQGASCAAGYDFADFLLGYPDVSSLRTGNDNNYFRGWAANAFAMDDWRVSRGLTINFGLRYEYFSPYTELDGHLANLDINPAFTAVDVVTASGVGTYFGQYPASLLKGDPHAFSPRFGLAWRPSQKNSRVIRLGYSIFYSGSSYSSFATQMAGQPPFANQVNITGTPASPITLENGFPPSPNTLTNQYAINPNYRLAYTQTWTVALQQTLPHNVLMELEYVGIKGTGLPVTLLPNQPVIPGAAVPSTDPGSAVRIPGASSFSYQTDIADSIMHAGQVRLTRRFTRGMSAVALYTFSKSIDDQSNQAEDPFNLSLDRALSSTDQRQRLNVTYVVSSPVGVRGLWRNGGWKTRMLAGWTTAGGFTYATGMPLTPTLGKDVSSWFYMRPFTTGLPLNAPGLPYFNLAAFSDTLPVGEYGDAGRDILTGIPTLSLNAQLNRAWRFGESRKQIQLSFRTNNVLNHVYITGFGTAVGSNSYGLPTAASGTRTVTCVLRFNF
ncbi:MAG TPA: carboxypeptidase-like regulatory domain-containing protein [Bryobacteraceae bacterium]|nr:carboxypeptidase-like regulatory domain-containing protein [Bryobacteraceae bacterium]